MTCLFALEGQLCSVGSFRDGYHGACSASCCVLHADHEKSVVLFLKLGGSWRIGAGRRDWSLQLACSILTETQVIPDRTWNDQILHPPRTRSRTFRLEFHHKTLERQVAIIYYSLCPQMTVVLAKIVETKSLTSLHCCPIQYVPFHLSVLICRSHRWEISPTSTSTSTWLQAS
jgi:hypothetical protein